MSVCVNSSLVLFGICVICLVMCCCWILKNVVCGFIVSCFIMLLKVFLLVVFCVCVGCLVSSSGMVWCVSFIVRREVIFFCLFVLLGFLLIICGSGVSIGWCGKLSWFILNGVKCVFIWLSLMICCIGVKVICLMGCCCC